MAERVMVVCDVCGKAPADPVGISVSSKSYRKDLCAEHLAELLRDARAPKRGRPAGARTATATATEPPKRRGRPPKARTPEPEQPSTPPETVKRQRRKITDPAILAKRRAALEKARQVRAANRAAAKGAS